MSASPLLLAVYGTLRRACGGLGRLDVDDRVAFVGECRFEGVLYDLERFPGAVPGGEDVHGDLFRLRDPQVWGVLDRYEGYEADREDESLFVRRQISLQAPSNCTAWVYWFNGDPAGHLRVPSGDWAAYVQGEGG